MLHWIDYQYQWAKGPLESDPWENISLMSLVPDERPCSVFEVEHLAYLLVVWFCFERVLAFCCLVWSNMQLWNLIHTVDFLSLTFKVVPWLGVYRQPNRNLNTLPKAWDMPFSSQWQIISVHPEQSARILHQKYNSRVPGADIERQRNKESRHRGSWSSGSYISPDLRYSALENPEEQNWKLNRRSVTPLRCLTVAVAILLIRNGQERGARLRNKWPAQLAHFRSMQQQFVVVAAADTATILISKKMD